MNNLGGCAAKLLRVETQLIDLKTIISSYTQDGHRVELEHDVKTGGCKVFVINLKGPPPILISVVTGEILHNLRSSIDHLTVALLQRAGETLDHWPGFPITQCEDSFRKVVGKLGGLSPTIIARIEELQPYKRRHAHEDPLLLLQTFHNIDKHTVLNIAHRVIYRGSRFIPDNVRIIRKGRNVHLKDRTYLFTHQTTDGTDPGKADVKTYVATDVFFRNPLSSKCLHPIYQLLQAIRSYLHENIFVQPGLIDGFAWDRSQFRSVQHWEHWLDGSVKNEW